MTHIFTRRSFLQTSAAAATTLLLPTPRADAHPGNYRSGLPTSAVEKIEELYAAGHGIKHVAFTSSGGWVVLNRSNGWSSDGVADSLNEKLHELNDAEKTIQQVIFAPEDGWMVLFAHDYGQESWEFRGMPQSLIDSIRRLDGEYSTIKSIAFTPDGGWAILHGFNGFIAEDIPEAAYEALNSLRQQHTPLKQIAFTSNSGWAILYGRNGFWTAGCPDGAHEKLGEYNAGQQQIHSIAFTNDDGWIVLYNQPEHASTQYWQLNGSDSSVLPLHAYAHDFSTNYDRHRILQQALYVLHDRFMSWPIIRNSYQISRDNYYVQGQYWADSNVASHPQYGPRELLWYQMQTLCLPASAQQAGDEGPPMPEIHLYPYYREDGSWGFARWTNRVMVKYESNESVRRTGDFHVHLNQYHLGGDGDGSDPYMWACVLGHEMLHNLGHAHDVDDYGDIRQVNCFHRALYCNGNYRGQDTPDFKCACKPPI